MPASPYSYAFALEHDYASVRHWALTGSFPASLQSLQPILLANEHMIKFWVRHNEAHRRMVFRNSDVTNLPLFIQGYAEFCETYELVEQALKQI